MWIAALALSAFGLHEGVEDYKEFAPRSAQTIEIDGQRYEQRWVPAGQRSSKSEKVEKRDADEYVHLVDMLEAAEKMEKLIPGKVDPVLRFRRCFSTLLTADKVIELAQDVDGPAEKAVIWDEDAITEAIAQRPLSCTDNTRWKIQRDGPHFYAEMIH